MLLAQLIIGFFSFFLLRPFTVLMEKTRAVKQSIFLDVYGNNPVQNVGQWNSASLFHTNGATTFSIMTLNKIGLYGTLSITRHFA